VSIDRASKYRKEREGFSFFLSLSRGLFHFPSGTLFSGLLLREKRRVHLEIKSRSTRAHQQQRHWLSTEKNMIFFDDEK
jgi:hypothetical protein